MSDDRAARVRRAMAKNKAFLASAANVHPKWHTPVAAIVAQGVCAMVMTLTPFPQLVIYIGFTLNIFAVMSVASLMLFRRREGWQKLRAVSFAYPAIPAVFLLVGAWMTIQGLQLKPYISLRGDCDDWHWRRSCTVSGSGQRRGGGSGSGNVLTPGAAVGL